MRPPLIHQGAGPNAIYDILDGQREQHRALIRMVDAIPEITSTTITRATAAGDERRLRGIPICAPGVGGAIIGSRPGAAL